MLWLLQRTERMTSKKGSAYPQQFASTFFVTPDIYMILIFGLKLKHLSQETYDSLIHDLKDNFDSVIESTFGGQNDFIFHGTYVRFFVNEVCPCRFPLKIQRVLSHDSGKTHALIPSCLIPYSQVPLETQIEIIESTPSDLFNLSVLYDLDLATLHRIRSLYSSHWKMGFDWFLDSIDTLVLKAFHLQHKQFMQTRGSIYIYPPT